jgi:hypothetical protein
VETIDELEIDTDGSLVFMAQTGVSGVGTGTRLGRLTAEGGIDTLFGAPQTPGFSVPLTMPEARDTVPAGFAHSLGGQWLVGASYLGEEVFNEDFFAARFTRSGQLDPSFGQDGIALVDLFHGGQPTDDMRTLVMHDNQPTLIGASIRVLSVRDPGQVIYPAVDTAVIKLEHSPLFGSGF